MTDEPKFHNESRPTTCLVLLISFVIAFVVFTAMVLPPMLGGRWDAVWTAIKTLLTFSAIVWIPCIFLVVFWKRETK